MQRQGVLSSLALLQCFIHRDPRQPGCEAGLPPEPVNMPEGLYKRVLHCFFRVFRVAENRKRYTKHAALVDPNQGLECPSVSGHNTINENEIVLGLMLFGVSSLFGHAVNGLASAWFVSTHAIGVLRKRIQRFF
jgi:hypothetical protein